MKIVGIYGSPRKGGNSDQLLDKALEGAASVGAETHAVYARKLKMSGCLECGSCDETAKCVVQDDMQEVYPLLEAADAVIVATPIFFYSVPAQLKAVMDRTQALWCKRLLRKNPSEKVRRGKGYLIALGATKGEKLFDCPQLTSRYFFDALDMGYEGGLFFRKLEKKEDAGKHPEMLDQAFELGRKAAQKD